MKVFGIVLAFLVSANAEFGLRGVSEVEQLEQFSCERSSQSQTQCDVSSFLLSHSLFTASPN
jgi:hypothetical protein